MESSLQAHSRGHDTLSGSIIFTATCMQSQIQASCMNTTKIMLFEHNLYSYVTHLVELSNTKLTFETNMRKHVV